ncbi:hypothetical protein EDB85DRAFT_1874265 [Lactarius pseudohatsudake]|nr:hypothetical protein EDB85DRAFT_1874265 [Lactarius pseudohatsudake]
MTAFHSLLIAFIGLFLIAFSATPSVLAYPSPPSSPPLWVVPRQTQQPYFPDTPASCPICAQNYPSISSCAQASTVMANFTSVLFNPGAFIDVIKCSCADTFQSVFPQCVDCFEKTNQTDVLDTPDLPSLVNSIRQVCAFASALLGNVSNSNGETTPTAAASATTPAATTSGAAPTWNRFGASLSLLITGAAAVIVFGASLL